MCIHYMRHVFLYLSKPCHGSFYMYIHVAIRCSKIKKLYDRYISLKADRDDTRRDYEQQVYVASNMPLK